MHSLTGDRTYDWRDGIGDHDKRPPRREVAWNGTESNDMGIDDFMTFCRLIGAEPYIAVNSGLGDDHSAAEEVEYVNGSAASRLGRLRAANGHPAPYGVKIWGIDNEMYGEWQWGHIAVTGNSPQHTVKGNVAVDLSARPSGSPTYPLDIFAALSADKKTLAISVVNPTETAQDCDLKLTGFQPVGGAKFWQLTAPPGKPSVPTGFGPGAFAGPPATMAEGSLSQAPGRVTLPPASISVYELAVKW